MNGKEGTCMVLQSLEGRSIRVLHWRKRTPGNSCTAGTNRHTSITGLFLRPQKTAKHISNEQRMRYRVRARPEKPGHVSNFILNVVPKLPLASFKSKSPSFSTVCNWEHPSRPHPPLLSWLSMLLQCFTILSDTAPCSCRLSQRRTTCSKLHIDACRIRYAPINRA
jgi:hypothetical protein